MSVATFKDAPSPRLCLVVKNTPTEEYGYNLHAERGKPQFIGTVDISSPADRAGLRPGDRIFAVNGHSIIGENHKRVVERIKENPLQCELLVISEEGADWYKEHNIPVTLSLPNIIHSSADTLRKQSDYSISQSKQTVDQKLSSASPTPDANWYAPKEQYYDKSASLQAKTPTATTDSNMTNKPRPRLCRLVKSSPSDEFGFNLHAEKSRGHFIGAVDKDGIGELAGLEMGQRIVGVNGHLIYPTTPHKEVVGLIKMNPLQTDLLVASEEVDRWYSENASEFSFDFIDRYQSNRSQQQQQSSRRGTASDRSMPSERERNVHSDNLDDHVSIHSRKSNDEEMNLSTNDDSKTTDVLGRDAELADNNYESSGHQHTHSLSVKREMNGYHDDDDDDDDDDHPITKTAESRIEIPVMEKGPELAKEALNITQQSASSDKDNHFTSPSSKITASIAPIRQPSPTTLSSHPLPQDSPQNFNNKHPQPGDDIFMMSAKEARSMLAHRKKDPRRDRQMTLDEKYRLITNM